MNRAETLLPFALALDESERIDLALRLLESVESPNTASDAERARAPVVAARVEALRAGTARTRPMVEAIGDIRARLLACWRA